MATAIPPLDESQKLEFGDATPLEQTAPGSLVVASYNIRYAAGRFLISSGLLRKAGLLGRNMRETKVAEHIQSAARALTDGKLLPRPDVIALQEADKQTKRTGGHHVARELAESLKMNWVHAPAGIPRGIKPKQRQWWLDFEEPIDLYDAGDTGVALLSRVELGDVKRLDLPWVECAWRPRLAIAATISTSTNSMRLINAHVDPHAAVGGQLEQVRILVDEADAFAGPSLIVGDFNTLSPKKVDQTRRFLESKGFSTPFPSGTPTWRGAGLLMHADWIFVRGVEIKRWGVARPLNVSDHWPIWAEIHNRPVQNRER